MLSAIIVTCSDDLLLVLLVQVVILTETKIDCTYPDSQFAQNGYSIYRNDRKKGGGGVMAYISDNYLPNG